MLELQFFILTGNGMEKIALITGASGGIGLEIAKLFAKEKINLLLTARSEKKLNSIKQQLEKDYKIKVYYVAADLSNINGVKVILNYVEENSLHIAYLINNAGFGDYGAFLERRIEKYREMIALNVSALVELTYYFSKIMIRQGYGKIMNVASTSGFQPVPYFAVYGASKAFVMSFTEALHKELEKTGVTVTVLSPGPTETGFMDKADMSNARLYKKGVMNAKDVALIGYKGMQKGKLHIVPGLRNRIMGIVANMMPPSRLRINISAKVMRNAN